MDERNTFINRSGELKPYTTPGSFVSNTVRDFINRQLRGIRILDSDEAAEFWTPHRQDIASRLFNGINRTVGVFGVPEMHFVPEDITLYKTEPTRGLSKFGSLPALTGSIAINADLSRLDLFFINHLALKVLPSAAARIYQVKGKSEDLRREGLAMQTKKFSKVAEIVEDTPIDRVMLKTFKHFERVHSRSWTPTFELLGLATTLMTKNQVLEQTFGIQQEGDSPETNLAWILIPLMHRIAATQRHLYERPIDTLPLFQKATFGKGSALELARTIEESLGRGSFHQLSEALGNINTRSLVSVDFRDVSSLPGVDNLIGCTLQGSQRYGFTPYNAQRTFESPDLASKIGRDKELIRHHSNRKWVTLQKQMPTEAEPLNTFYEIIKASLEKDNIKVRSIGNEGAYGLSAKGKDIFDEGFLEQFGTHDPSLTAQRLWFLGPISSNNCHYDVLAINRSKYPPDSSVTVGYKRPNGTTHNIINSKLYFLANPFAYRATFEEGSEKLNQTNLQSGEYTLLGIPFWIDLVSIPVPAGENMRYKFGAQSPTEQPLTIVLYDPQSKKLVYNVVHLGKIEIPNPYSNKNQ